MRTFLGHALLSTNSTFFRNNVWKDYFFMDIRFNGAWLISLFEFKIDDGCNFEILTASSTCLVRGSLKTDVMENCHLLGSFEWWLVWCLCRGLKSLFLFNFLMCSMNLTLAGLPVSPSYDDSLPWSLQLMHVILYPTPSVEQGVLKVGLFPGSDTHVFLQIGQRESMQSVGIER